MTIKPLVDQLHRDALEERERRLGDARAHALRLVEDAEHSWQRERHDALAERERAVRAELDRERAVVSRQCQLEQLHARRRLVERCLSSAAGRTRALHQSAGFVAALTRQVERALGYLPSGGCRIRCAPVLEGELRALRDAASVLEIVADPTIDFGFVVESSDGFMRVDATLGTLIARERDALAIEIVKRFQLQAT